jgi:hypothetical protein
MYNNFLRSPIPFLKFYPPHNDIDEKSNHIHKEEEILLLVISNLEEMPDDM